MISNDPKSAVSALENFTDEQLFGELGERLWAVGAKPELASQFDFRDRIPAETMGLADDIKAFGKRFFERMNTQAYALVCGADAQDRETREKLSHAIGLGKEATAATLATLLVAHLGLAPLVAPVVAILIVRLFFKPAHGAMCDVWKEKIESKPNSAQSNISGEKS